MSIDFKNKSEKRISIKIFAHKLKSFSPNVLYPMFICLRYFLFRSKCKSENVSDISYSDGDWSDRKTTKDLKKIETYLSRRSGEFSVFQVGIGNSSLFDKLKSKDSIKVHGITIMQQEIDYANSRYEKYINESYFLRISNKYLDVLGEVGGAYDVIVDNDISSYACCKFHFHRLLDNYSAMLNLEGELLVGYMGLSYFDSGFGLTETQFLKIAKEHGFTVEKTEYCYKLMRKK